MSKCTHVYYVDAMTGVPRVCEAEAFYTMEKGEDGKKHRVYSNLCKFHEVQERMRKRTLEKIKEI